MSALIVTRFGQSPIGGATVEGGTLRRAVWVPTTIRAPHVPQRSTPRRASSRSDFARRPRGERIFWTPCHVGGSTIAACESGSRARRSGARRARSASARSACVPWNDRSMPCSRRCSRTCITVAPSARSRNASATARPPSGAARAALGVAPVTGRHFRERRHAASDRAPLRVLRPLRGDAAVVLGDHSEHRRAESQRRGRVRADLTDVDRDYPAAGRLDPLDDFALHRQGTHEPVEVGDDDDVRLAGLDHLDRAPEPSTLRERSAAADVELLDRLDELRARRARRPSRIRSACSDGQTNRSPSRSPTRETRTTPTARREEVRLVVEGEPGTGLHAESDTGERSRCRPFAGEPVILYFYPKDDTPGCTTQACGIRDAWSEFEQAGAVVLGVFPTASASHGKFKGEFELPFTLLADPDHAVAEAYGVWVEKSRYGQTYMGIERSTFVIGPDGNVVKIMRERQAGDARRRRARRARPEQRSASTSATVRLAARIPVALAELVDERLLELARALHLLDDVGAADQLALDEHLRDRRPARDRREVLADPHVEQDVDRRDRRARAAQRSERPLAVAAHDRVGRALHEERDVRAVDHFLDLLGVAHCLVDHGPSPFVLIRSSWMLPSLQGSSSAW